METTRGRAIKAARQQQHLSQEALASGICDRSTISRIERGTYEPLPDLWERLAERLNLPRAYPARDSTGKATMAPPSTVKHIRLALLAKHYDDASQTALTALWALLESGSIESAMDLGRRIVTAVTVSQWGHEQEWVAVLSALLFHQVNRQAYHEVFRLGLLLQQVNGQLEHYEDILMMNRILLTFNPPRRVRTELMIGMGTAYLRQKQFGEAFVTFQQTMEDMTGSDDGINDAKILHGLSAAHLGLGNWDTAARTATRASVYYRSLAHEFYWLAHQNWGRALLQGSKNRSAGIEALQACADHWQHQQRHQEYLSVQEDLFIGSYGIDSGVARNSLDAALAVVQRHPLTLPRGFEVSLSQGNPTAE